MAWFYPYICALQVCHDDDDDDDDDDEEEAATGRGEAENDVKVVLGSRQEVVVEVLAGRRSSRHLFLHDRHKVLLDLVDLVLGEQIGDLARAQHVVDELEERFVFDFVVREDERHSVAVSSGHAIQQLEIFHQIVHVVRPQRHSKTLC